MWCFVLNLDSHRVRPNAVWPLAIQAIQAIQAAAIVRVLLVLSRDQGGYEAHLGEW